MSAKLRFYDAAGVEPISLLDFGAFTPGETGDAVSFTLKNLGADGVSDLNLGAMSAAWTWDGTALLSQGLEVIAEQWLEARAGGIGAWTPIGGNPATPANVLALGPLGAYSSVALELRLNPPADAGTAGNIVFIPFWFANGEFGT